MVSQLAERQIDKEKIFSRALELDLHDREAYIASACDGDGQLIREIRGLLNFDGEATSFLEGGVFQSHSEENSTPGTIGYVGDYEIMSEVARGGMGVVYRARQRSLKRIVALKMIHSPKLASADQVSRFRREAEAAAGLDHPNVVPIFEIGEYEGQHYFSMKLIEGATLKDRLGDLHGSSQQIAQLMARVSRAIHAAHLSGVLHRDLKPSNILIDQDGQPHITDFGLARVIDEECDLTHTGQIVGTPSYMSPEQACGRGLTTASDTHSLGAILFELLTGEPPYAASTIVETLKLVSEANIRQPSTIIETVDRDLETIALRCLEKQPERRYASALAVAEDLERWSRGEAISARSVSAVERFQKWVRRRPLVAAVWGLLAVILLILGVGGPIAAFQQAQLRHKSEVAEELARERAITIERNLYFSEMSQAAMSVDQPGGVARIRELVDHWGGPSSPEVEIDRRDWEWHFLNSYCHAYELSIPKSPLTRDMRSTANGQLLVSGHGKDVWIKWQNRDKARLLKGHDATVCSVDTNAAGTRVASFALDGTVRIWEPQTGQELVNFDVQVARPQLTSLRWSPNGEVLALSSYDDETRFFNPSTGELISQCIASNGRYAWSPNGTEIAASRAGKVSVANTLSGEVTRQFTVPKYSAASSSITAISWSPDGAKLAVSTYDGKISVFPIEGEEHTGSKAIETVQLAGHDQVIWCLAWNQGSNQLASSSKDGLIRIWDVEERRLVTTLAGHEASVDSVCWLGTDRLASSSKDGTVKLWSLDSKVAEILTHVRPVGAIAWSPDAEYLVAQAVVKGTRVWNASTGELVFEKAESPRVKGEWHASVSWQPAGRRFAALSVGGGLAVYDIDTGAAVEEYQPKEGSSITVVEWSGDGRSLFYGNSAAAVFRWDLETDTHVRIPWQAEGLTSLTAGPVNCPLVSTSRGGLIQFWDPSAELGSTLEDFVDGKQRRELRIAWHPSGQRIAIADRMSSKIKIWDTVGKELVSEFSTGAHFNASIAWHPSGSRLLAGTTDGSVSLWDTESQKLVMRLQGHTRTVLDVAWSHGGKRFASASEDFSVRVWKADYSYPTESNPK